MHTMEFDAMAIIAHPIVVPIHGLPQEVEERGAGEHTTGT
jgi:hypothetical protein